MIQSLMMAIIMFSFNLIFPPFISDSVGSIGLSNMRAYDVGTSRFGVHGRRYAMRMRQTIANNSEEGLHSASKRYRSLSHFAIQRMRKIFK